MNIKIYTPIEGIAIDNTVNKLELNRNQRFVFINDLLKLIDDEIKYLKDNELYPAFCLNSEVRALERLKEWFQ